MGSGSTDRSGARGGTLLEIKLNIDDPRYHIMYHIMYFSFTFQNATVVTSYFPKSVWFDAYTLEWHESQGDYIELSAPMDKIPLYFRAGFIIPFQEPGLTTEER